MTSTRPDDRLHGSQSQARDLYRAALADPDGADDHRSRLDSSRSAAEESRRGD